MNKKAFLPLFLLFGLVIGSYGQALDTVSRAVIYLQHNSSPSNYISGTGFLVYDHAIKGDYLFLVTAKHVAINMDFTTNTSFAIGLGSNPETETFHLSTLRGSYNGGWLHHDIADVSVLPLHPSPEFVRTISPNVLAVSTFLVPGTNCPSRDASLTMIGFPFSLGWGRISGEPFSPLTRKSGLASGFININGIDWLLLQDPVVQGYSGGPLFDLETTAIKNNVTFIGSPPSMICYGVVEGTIPDETGGKIGAVVPIKYVIELINKSERL